MLSVSAISFQIWIVKIWILWRIGHGLGARRIGPGLCVEPGPKGPDEPGPMAHMAALLSVLGENIVDKEQSGINGITRAEP